MTAETRMQLRQARDRDARQRLGLGDGPCPVGYASTYGYKTGCRCHGCTSSAKDAKARQRARSPEHHRALWRAAHARRRARRQAVA